MSHFPVTHSNLSASHLAIFLQQVYAIGEPLGCSILKSGINDTYLVTAPAGRYIFRVYSLAWRTKEEIGEEIKLLLLLKDNDLSVSYPLADAAGSYIKLLHAPEGDRYGVLFSYAEGEKLPQYDQDTHYSVGELMARIHTATHNMELQRPTYNETNLLLQPLIEISNFLPDGTAPEMAFMATAQQYLLTELRNANVAELRHGIVHMDIWFDNLNINSGKQITIFDFDFCGNGWLCLDIAYYILQLHSVEKDETICLQKVNSFLSGYESITAISAEEKRLLPALGVAMYFFYLGIQCSRFHNFSNVFLNPAYLRRFITVLVKGYFEKQKLGINALQR